jgi:16S rRNA processing protein RimM
MNKETCFEVGGIIRPHALLGELLVFLDVDNPADYLDIETIFVEKNGQLVPYFVEALHLQPNGRALLSLDGIDTIEAAKSLVGLSLFLPDSYLPALDDDEFYIHELIGFELTDQHLGRIGTVENIYELPTQNALVLTYQGKEVLVLMQSEWIVEFDKAKKTLLMNLPEGLLDVYLDT